jgi:hypothetical protein
LRLTFWLYATFGAGNRALRSNDPCPKYGREKPHKGRKPDCGFSEPEPPQGGEAHTDLLHDDFPYIAK